MVNYSQQNSNYFSDIQKTIQGGVVLSGQPVSASAAGTNANTATIVDNSVRFIQVINADDTKGIKIPAPTAAGMQLVIDNTASAGDLNVYPDTGITINATTSLVIANGVINLLIANSTTNWQVLA